MYMAPSAHASSRRPAAYSEEYNQWVADNILPLRYDTVPGAYLSRWDDVTRAAARTEVVLVTQSTVSRCVKKAKKDARTAAYRTRSRPALSGARSESNYRRVQASGGADGGARVEGPHHRRNLHRAARR